MAFIVAGLIFAGSLAIGAIGLLADSMSDAPGKTSGVGGYVIGGIIISILVAGTHWLPHINW